MKFKEWHNIDQLGYCTFTRCDNRIV